MAWPCWWANMQPPSQNKWYGPVGWANISSTQANDVKCEISGRDGTAILLHASVFGKNKEKLYFTYSLISFQTRIYIKA